MTGSEHYTVAERLIDLAWDSHIHGDAVQGERDLRFAEVHASLANAAAIALAATFEPSDGETAQAWRRAIQYPPHMPS